MKLPLFEMTPLSLPHASTAPTLVRPPSMVPLMMSLAPLLTSVMPVYVFRPCKVCVPPEMITPPEPEITPSNLPAASVILRICAPSTTAPLEAPARLLMEAPLVVAEILNVPSAMTEAEAAILPAPDSASDAPETISVSPL